MRMLTISCAILALCACHKPAEPERNEQAANGPAEPVKGVDRSHRGEPMPATVFNDADGQETSLAALEGKPTLVNLWASWCAPCVKELPTLDRLAQTSGGKMNVVAVSEDSGPHASVEAFLDKHKVKTLDAYQDSKMALSGSLHADVLPTSVLYDSSGKEVWRYVGDLDWTSADAARLLAEGGGVTGG